MYAQSARGIIAAHPVPQSVGNFVTIQMTDHMFRWFGDKPLQPSRLVQIVEYCQSAADSIDSGLEMLEEMEERPSLHIGREHIRVGQLVLELQEALGEQGRVARLPGLLREFAANPVASVPDELISDIYLINQQARITGQTLLF